MKAQFLTHTPHTRPRTRRGSRQGEDKASGADAPRRGNGAARRAGNCTVWCGSVQRVQQVGNLLPPFQLLLKVAAFLCQPGENLAHVIESVGFLRCAGDCLDHMNGDGRRGVALVAP